MAVRNPHLAAVKIVAAAGGELVGRTRLQKIAYLMQLAGLGSDLGFEYHHFGPYSENLARGVDIATAFGLLKEEEKLADWGGKYSIFRICHQNQPDEPKISEFVQCAKKIGALELELAATAAFLFTNEKIGQNTEYNPWEETRRRKPEKARNGRLERAFDAYETLRRRFSSSYTLPKLPPPSELQR